MDPSGDKKQYFKQNIYWNDFIVELKFKELEMEDKIKKIKVFFEEKYDPEILFLYGSFATKTFNNVTLIVFVLQILIALFMIHQ